MSASRRRTNNPVDDMYNVWTDNFSNREQQQLYEATQAWAENLRQSTIDSSLSAAGTRSDLTIEQTWLQYEKDIHTLIWFISAIDKLLEEVQDTRKWLSKKWLSKAWKRTIDNAKKKLKQYEKVLKWKRETVLKQSWREITDSEIWRLRDLWTDLNKVREEIWMWQRWDYASIASYLYNSPEVARKSNKYQARDLEFNQNFQQELKEWAILNIFNRSTQKANDFFRRIAQWEYTQADYQLYISNEGILNPFFQRYWINAPTNPNWWRERTSQTTRRWVDYSNMDRWETFQQWWLTWVLDKALASCSNMTPWQRETWKNLAVLWSLAAWIYWLYKFYTSKRSFLTKAWVTVAAIFWSQALTWEWPFALFQKLLTWWFSKEYLESKFWNLLWNAVSWIWDSWAEVSQTVTPAMYSMMIFNPSTNVWQIREMTSRFSSPAEWKIFREWAINKLKDKYGISSAEYFSATFTENFDKEKRTNRLESFWIRDWVDNKTNIYEIASNASLNEIILERFKTQYWLKETSDSQRRKEFRDYMANLRATNQALDYSVLKQHPERFQDDNDATYTEREEDTKTKEYLVSQIASLSIDYQKKSELETAIKRFYDERALNAKPHIWDFSLRTENDLLILKSHSWYETKIDLDKKELIRFRERERVGISFTNLADLLNAADLTNKILESQKWKKAENYPPFKYKRKEKWIYFNNAKDIRNDLISFNRSWRDTRVLSSWRWWASKQIESIDKKLEDYAECLSRYRMEANREKFS